MRLVYTKDITPEMILSKPVYYHDHILLTPGQNNIDRYKMRLLLLGIHHVYIEDPASEGIEIPDILSEETRRTCKNIVYNTMTNYALTQHIDILTLQKGVHLIMEDILKNDDVLISLFDIRSTDDYTFSHCVSVTAFSLLIAKHLGYSNTKMLVLGTGALLHDIGKILIPNHILNKPTSLTPEEMEILKQHPILGYESLKKQSTISEASRIVVLHHHEKVNGEGYPHQLRGNEIHEFAKIVSIADVFDALTSDRCYRARWSSYKAVEYLMGKGGEYFDIHLLSLFIRNVAIYPNGTLVTLSTGEKGIIKDQNPSMSLRPIVRIIENKYHEPIPPYDLDLLKELSVTIIASDS